MSQVYEIPDGATFRACKACQTPITFVTTAKGKQMPVTRDGVSHYLTCTEPKRFSKKAA